MWTFRHFTDSKDIGEFEYAVWSLLWGSVLFLLIVGVGLRFCGYSAPTVPLNDPAALLGSAVGMGLAIAFGTSPIVGFIGAGIARAGFFRWIDRKLSRFLDRIAKERV